MILNVKGKSQQVEFSAKTLIISGFAVKDRILALKHIEEMKQSGLSVPEKIPAFYSIDPALITDSPDIQVGSKETSGEVEPVLITTGGKMYIGVGSDHTARDLGRKDIEESKEACGKPISREVFELEYALKNWKHLSLRSFTLDNGKEILYQEGKVTSLLQIHEILDGIREWNGSIDLQESAIFLGTVPLATGDFVYSDWYRVELTDEKNEKTLNREYRVKNENRS